jgi:hypothetical protein
VCSTVAALVDNRSKPFSGRCEHGQAFRVEPIMTQIVITTGEPLFQVDYEDPGVDNLYFDDADVVEFNKDS